jgi:glycosyltransferase involved in cell wall biosynthesis
MILDLADMYSMIKPKFVVNKAFNDSDKIFVITKYLEKILIKNGISPTKISHIPNGVDLELFNPTRFLSESNEIRKTFTADKIVIFTGSLQDLTMIIKSAKKVIKEIPNLKYVIIGDHRDPTKSSVSWQKKVDDEGLSDYFEFLGRKPREEIPKYILSADVCLDSFPDEPYFAAAHPIKLLEYGACEKPVLATNVTETANIIKHGKFGYLATPGNYDEYAKYLIVLLQSDEKSKNMGVELGKFVRDNFDWNEISSKLINSL